MAKVGRKHLALISVSVEKSKTGYSRWKQWASISTMGRQDTQVINPVAHHVQEVRRNVNLGECTLPAAGMARILKLPSMWALLIALGAEFIMRSPCNACFRGHSSNVPRGSEVMAKFKGRFNVIKLTF